MGYTGERTPIFTRAEMEQVTAQRDKAVALVHEMAGVLADYGKLNDVLVRERALARGEF